MKSSHANAIPWPPAVSGIRGRSLRACLTCLWLGLVASAAFADVGLPAIVGDNMILQQRMGTPIWGWANPGETVTVAGSWGNETSATADGIVLQPYAGTPIEGWMPKQVQMDDPRTRKIVEEMDAQSAAFHPGLAERQFARATESWKQGERKARPTMRTPVNWGHHSPSR